MRTVVLFLDTVKKDYLSIYNEKTVAKTPNITKLAADSVKFNEHWLGSAPCIPARRDILTGRYNFLERSWGPIEPFDITLPQLLKEHQIFSHIVTDHAHYFRIGGENYCQQFNSWEFIRGQESDPWVSRIDDPYLPKEYYGDVKRQYQWNRTKFVHEEDYPTPKVFSEAEKWLEDNQDADDFVLFVEGFDPHEPFDVPQKYLNLYEDHYQGPQFDLPKYHRVDEPDIAMTHLKKEYMALLTMADQHLGQFIDKLKALDMYEDTLIIFTSDHGYFLGEKSFLGKNYMPVYNELAALPLLVHLPKGAKAGSEINALTQNIDIMPTILSYYNLAIPKEVQGKSWRPLLQNTQTKIRDELIYGYHGMAVNYYDGVYTYLKAPQNKENQPCFEYTCSLTTIRHFLGEDVQDTIEMGRFLPRTDYPVYKVPCHQVSLGVELAEVMTTELFNIKKDAQQTINILTAELEVTFNKKLAAALQNYEAPQEQYERLGLTLNKKN